MSAGSLIDLLNERCAASGKSVALRHRTLGLWLEVSWDEYRSAVAEAAQGLRRLGVKSGDRIAIVSDDHPTWLYTALGAQTLGAVSTGLNPQTSPDYLSGVLSELNVVLVVVGDQEQLDKIIEQRSVGRLPSLRQVVVVDTRGIRHLDAADTSTVEGVTTWSKMTHDPESTPPAGLAVDRDPDSPGLELVGLDRSVRVFSHRELVEMANTAGREFRSGPADSCLAVSSFATEGSLLLDVLAPLSTGMTVNIGQGGVSTLRELSEVRPTVLTAPPELLDRIKSDADQRAAGTRNVKKLAYAAALRRGATRSRSKVERKTNAPILLIVSVVFAIGMLFLSGRSGASKPLERLAPPLVAIAVFLAVIVLGGFAAARPVRNRYGLGRLHTLNTGGQELNADLVDWLWRIGVPAKSAAEEIQSILTIPKTTSSDSGVRQ